MTTFYTREKDEIYGPTVTIECPECGETAARMAVQSGFTTGEVTVEVTCDYLGIGCGNEFMAKFEFP